MDSIELEGTLSREQIRTYMKMFQVSFEERDQVLRPLAEGGQEATASMGDDTPMAVLSSKHRNVCLLYTSPSPRDGLLSRMPSSA